MRDEQLVALGREYEDLRQRHSRIEAKMETLKQKVLGELDRRGTKSIEHGNAKVTFAQRNDVVINAEKLAEKLTPRQFKKVTYPSVDKGLLEAEVQAGRIDPDKVAQCSDVFPSKPWIRVTIKSD